MINHTVKGGKYLRGNIAFNTAKLCSSFYKTHYSENLAVFLGVAVEFV
jgi:hypothetical protein